MNAVRRVAATTISTSALLLPAAAWADCTASGSTVTCSGASASYTYTGTTAATVNVASGATVTAPLTVATANSTLTNAGTISNTAAAAGVNYTGAGAVIVNNGTITSTGSTGATAITASGNGSTVTNNGVLTATSGTPVVNLGTNGTFNNTNATTVTAAVTGTIQFAQGGTLNNTNTSYGISGVVSGTGSLTINNAGILSGSILQSSVSGSTVTIDNAAAGTLSAYINTSDVTNLTNEGSMTVYGSTSNPVIGSALSGISTLTNSGTLSVGYQSAPTQLTVDGNVTLNSSGTLVMAIGASTIASSPLVAGTGYSQLYASNGSGSANLTGAGNVALGGALELSVGPGFYANNSKYDIILADGTISGSFSKTNAYTFVTTSSTDSSGVTTSTTTKTPLAFVTFSTGNVVALTTGQQAYEVTATHLKYSDVLAANGATANQTAVAKGLDPLITKATDKVNASTADDSITLLSMVDLMSVAQAKTFFDQVSPEGYYAYATALRDQANAFARTVDLRMNDQNSTHPEDGWWASMQGQFQFASTADTSKGFKTRDRLVGFSGGYDLSGPNHVIGAAFNASWDSLVYSAGSLRGTNRDFGVALYGAQNVGPFRVSGQLAYNFGHLGATHTTTIGTYTVASTAKASEGLFKATANVGYAMNLGSYKLTPFVGIDFMKGQVNGFTETGAGAADLTVGRIKADRTDALAGFNFTRAKGVFRPYARAAFRRQVGGGANNVINAYFDGENSGTYNTSFQVTAAALGKNQVEANAGVNWVFDDAGALFVGYQGTMRTGYQSHGINLGIRLEF